MGSGELAEESLKPKPLNAPRRGVLRGTPFTMVCDAR